MASMNVMFAWELGAGMGHVERHLDLADLLRRRGAQVTFVVKNLRLADAVLRPRGFRCLQAPQVPSRSRSQGVMASYADILAYHGLADEDRCRPLLAAWIDVFRLCHTDVVLLDHAPAALFAAKCCGVRTVSLDIGFCRPPDVSPFPSFRPDLALELDELLRREQACVAQMRSFSDTFSVSVGETLADCVRPDVTLLNTFPELDHYPQRTAGCYIGAIQSYSSGEVMTWRHVRRHKVFVYLRGIPGMERIMAGLKESDAEYIVYSPDLTQAQRLALADAAFQVSHGPVRVDQVLQGCDLVVSNGGHGLVSACLLHGVNVLAVPLYVEQRLMVDCLRRAGIGMGVPMNRLETELRARFDEVLESGKYKLAATNLREKYRDYDLTDTLTRVAEISEREGMHDQRADLNPEEG